MAFRIPTELTKRLDALAEREPDQPNRSEMVRRLLEMAVASKERRHG
jgi:metal-responsive CopG/Arc/MetJ family transcriptional regulator